MSDEKVVPLRPNAPNTNKPLDAYSVFQAQLTALGVPVTSPDAARDALTVIVRNAHLFFDMASSDPAQLLHLVDKNNFSRTTFSAINLKRAIGKDEYLRAEARTIPARFQYRPDDQRLSFYATNGEAIFNTYEPPTWRLEAFYKGVGVPAGQSIPALYERFFEHLVDGDAASKEYLYDWIANSLRARNHTILTLIGDQGIGKGTLGAILERLHGSKNYYKGQDRVLKTRFNAQIASKTLFYIDEIALDTKEAHDRLKELVNAQIEVERKGVDAAMAQNYANIYISSNHMEAIQIEPSDRRFSVANLTERTLPDAFSLAERAALYSDEALLTQFAQALWHRQVNEAAMLKPFRSKSRFHDIRESTLKEWELFLLYEWAPRAAGKDYVTNKDLSKLVTDKYPRITHIGRNKLAELAKKFPESVELKKHGAVFKFRSLLQPAVVDSRISRLTRETQ